MSEEDKEDPAPLKSSLRKTEKTKKRRPSRRLHQSEPSMAALFSPDSRAGGGGGGLEEEAEGHLLRVLEERRARAKSKDADWDASVEGEQPPLRRVSFHGAAMFSPAQKEEKDEQVKSNARLRFRNLALKVREMQSSRQLNVEPLDESPQPNQNQPKEDEEPGNERDVFEGVGGEDTQIGKSAFSQNDTNTDMVISAAMAVNENYAQDDDTASILSESVYSDDGTAEQNATDDERLPLTGFGRPLQQKSWFGGATARRRMRKRWRRRKKRCLKKLYRMCRCHRFWFSDILHPVSLMKATYHFLTSSAFAKLGVLSLVAAFVLFYFLRNPSLDFIGVATVSWWLVFISRQTLTLQLAIVSESIIIDGLALKSRYAVKILSPLLTLCIVSSKGWPFLCTFWALWDLTIFYGDNEFQQNWLYWSEIKLFSSANTGGQIIENDIYRRLLLAMILAGVTCSIKRTALALYFGKKTVLNYKARMDKILADMLVLSDVALLSCEVEALLSGTPSSTPSKKSIQAAVTEQMSNRKKLVSDAQWQNIKDMEDTSEASKPETLGEAPDTVMEVDDVAEQKPSDSFEAVENESLTDSDSNVDDDDDDDDNQSDSDSSDSDSSAPGGQPNQPDRQFSDRVSISTSEKRFKNLLDRWEEPENISTKTTDASISDILEFRQHLAFMDTAYPFSSYFGKARTRDECIKASQKTYRRLMKLDPGAGVLSFDVISLLAIDPDGVEDESRKRILKRLFRPGIFNEVTLLAFVQTCDSVYKRLRYFRASVGNSSVIDQVLEQIIDGVFYFVLLLSILCLLKYNPWTLLVSLSTLLFSTAFAIGPSLSRYIEGVLMIIARRPYDLGDRIFMVSSDNPNVFGSAAYSWFVEDLNLFSTTLRFANTNEVATVNNAAIVNARVVNGNRSPNALITLTLYFTDKATEDQLALFRDAIDSFVQDRPRIWDSVAFFRCESINQDLGMMEYLLRIRHTKSWQDASSIMTNKAEVLKFCFETGKKLEINYDSPPRATWTINSFASPPGEGNPADIEAALQSFTGRGSKEESPSGRDLDTAAALFQGKAKGMRSLESRISRTGGQFTFNH